MGSDLGRREASREHGGREVWRVGSLPCACWLGGCTKPLDA